MRTKIEMNYRTLGYSISVIKGDITKLEVDAIVNAAHEDLTSGGGVDGAIHRAAGHQLLGECLNLFGCPVGEARITGGYNLPAKYVIHTVGPVWIDSKSEEEKKDYMHQLEHCYASSLFLAEFQGLKTIAFPCISTGAFCFPKELAARTAIEIINRLKKISQLGKMSSEPSEGTYLNEITFVCFDDDNYEIYTRLLKEIL